MSESTLHRSDFVHIEKAKESKFAASHDVENGNIDFTIEASTFTFDRDGNWYHGAERFHFIVSADQAFEMWKALCNVIPNGNHYLAEPVEA